MPKKKMTKAEMKKEYLKRNWKHISENFAKSEVQLNNLKRWIGDADQLMFDQIEEMCHELTRLHFKLLNDIGGILSD